VLGYSARRLAPARTQPNLLIKFALLGTINEICYYDYDTTANGRIQLLGESMGRVGISSLPLFYLLEVTSGKCPPTETFAVGISRQKAAFGILERSRAMPILHAISPYFWIPPNSGCARC